MNYHQFQAIVREFSSLLHRGVVRTQHEYAEIHIAIGSDQVIQLINIFSIYHIPYLKLPKYD